MREIKFRGCDEHGDWHYGAFMGVLFDGVVAPIEYANIYDDGMANRVLPDTVGQFTGMYDCDGHEIYEGDIVKFTKPAYTDVPVVITWEDGAFMVDHDLYLGGRDLSRVTVIGNVHDNSDLLEAEHD